MRPIADGVHVSEAPLRFLGLQLGARMTVLDTGSGLLLHSPVACAPELVAAAGTPRWVVAPNLFHHLYAGPWIDRGLEGWVAPGLPEKRPDLAYTGVLGLDAAPFGPEIGVFPLSFFGLTNEVVLLHRPSRTLVVTDLVFHVTNDAPLATRVALACVCGYPGCRTTLIERVGFRRTVARREIGQLLDQDFDRLVMAHGRIIESGGKDALRGAMRWLGV